MRHKIIGLLVLLFTVASCSQLTNLLGTKPQPTPLTRVYQLRVDYTATMKILTQARMLGKISDEQAIEIEKVRAQAATALDLVESAASVGKPVSPELLSQAVASVDLLIAATAKYK